MSAAEERDYYRGIREFADYRGDVRERADVVVVGSGPTGAVAAYNLAAAGLDVILLEAGPVRRPRDFTLSGGKTLADNFWEGGLRVMRGRAMTPTMQARVLGGGSHVNSAICVRTPQFCFDDWRTKYGVEAIDRAVLDPHYDRVEQFLGVRYTEEHAWGRRNALFKEGCDAMGISSEPTPRNVVDCGGCGECFTGCPTRAKKSMEITYIPAAVEHGMRVLTCIETHEVLWRDGRVTGIGGYVVDPITKARVHRVQVDAPTVVLATGCLATPVILQKSRVPDPRALIGRDLQAHPGCAFLGIFDEDVNPWVGATQGYQSLHYLDRGFKLEVLWAPPEVLAVRLPDFGLRFKEHLAAMKHAAPWDTFFALDHAKGRVRARRGKSILPDVAYNIPMADMPRIREGLDVLAQLFFAAGAKQMQPGIHGLPTVVDDPRALSFENTAKLKPNDIILAATHLFSTTRLGPDPHNSVVDEDGEMHHLEGCFVVDTGIMPKSPAVNPMLTGMALSDRISTRLAARLSSQSGAGAA